MHMSVTLVLAFTSLTACFWNISSVGFLVKISEVVSNSCENYLFFVFYNPFSNKMLASVDVLGTLTVAVIVC
jgi:hypothetical protein